MAGSALAQLAADAPFDLLIKGGEALDPSQQLRAVRDVGIRLGVVTAVERDIAATRARAVIDARGKLVTPGLVDHHTHIYPYASAMSVPPDELVPQSATTTPAGLIGKIPKLGTLQVGAPGDVSILERVPGTVTLLDSVGQARTGKEHRKAVLTVRNGVPFGAPYPIPFTVS